MDAHTDVPVLGELDLAIIHALQIDARAPWARIAAAVGADAATVTRRWRSLQERGLAWLTLWPTPQRWARTTDIAVMLLEADAAAREAVLELPWVLGLDETSAGLLTTVAGAQGLEGLGHRARELSSLGARVRRMDVAAAIVQEDSTWRLQALARPQQRRLSDTSGPADAGRLPSEEVTAEIAAALSDDPRLPALTLARQLGVSEPTARRALDRLVAAHVLRFGCDLSLPAAGLLRGSILWARARETETAAAHAARIPEAHRVGVMVGPAPLFVCVRTRSLTGLPAIERAWQDGVEVEVVDRWTVLRPWKRNGHVLDGTGRSVRRIPVEW